MMPRKSQTENVPSAEELIHWFLGPKGPLADTLDTIAEMRANSGYLDFALEAPCRDAAGVQRDLTRFVRDLRRDGYQVQVTRDAGRIVAIRLLEQ
jgi:hypothetical protein